MQGREDVKQELLDFFKWPESNIFFLTSGKNTHQNTCICAFAYHANALGSGEGREERERRGRGRRKEKEKKAEKAEKEEEKPRCPMSLDDQVIKMNINNPISYTNCFATCLPRFSSSFPCCNQTGSVRAQRSISQTMVKEKKHPSLHCSFKATTHLPPSVYFSLFSFCIYFLANVVEVRLCIKQILSKYISPWMLGPPDFHFFRIYIEVFPLFSDFYPLPITMASDEILYWTNLSKAQVSPFPQHEGTSTYNCIPANLTT